MTGMKLIAVRTKMACGHRPHKRASYGGCCYAYDLYVPEADLPAHFTDEEDRIGQSYRTVITGPDGRRLNVVRFDEATRPADICALPQGWEKYEQANAHRETARRDAWAVIRTTFPETVSLGTDSLPDLWVSYDPKPNIDSATVWSPIIVA